MKEYPIVMNGGSLNLKAHVIADVVIVGGGIAGLWLLNDLKRQGLSALLFESHALGSGQTQKSQGILHGGLKYALQGQMTHEALTIREAPVIWQDCLNGRGPVDLREVAILSEKQHLFAPNKFTAKLAGFFASKALDGKVEVLTREKYPTLFQSPHFKGDVFALNEVVINVHHVIKALAKAHQDAIYKIEPITEDNIEIDEKGNIHTLAVHQSGQSMTVKAQYFIFTAGSGNEIIGRKFKNAALSMQKRPLHMVMVQPTVKHGLYAHCLSLSNRPRLTITTHTLKDGQLIWYLGGALAEDGIHKTSNVQIQTAKKELQQIFPWINFANAAFQTCKIDRAEAKQKNGLKPESYYYHCAGNAIVAWPTKLVLAPKLAETLGHFVISHIKADGRQTDLRALRTWPLPVIAPPIWDELFCKNVA